MSRKLAVCYPWSLEFVGTRFADTALNLNRPVGYATKFFRGRGWCAARRHNHCLEQAIEWGADLICIIGADQTYQSEDMLEKLVARHHEGYEMITALVPTRGYVGGQGTKPFQSIVWKHKRDANGNMLSPKSPSDGHIITKEDGDIVRADGCGTGVLLFPADALKWVKAPWFTEIASGPSFERTACADWPFINRLQREAELKLWCDTTIGVKHLQMFEIDESFQERFADWAEEGKGDKSTCEYRSPSRFDGEIDQCRVSPSIPHYRNFPKQNGMKEYSRQDQPAFFFGCYTKEDFQAIRDHASTAVIVWAGTDALNMRKALESTGKHPFGPRVRHVAISKFIADDLDAMGLKYVRLPLTGASMEKYKPVPLGKAVYCYCPYHDSAKYGGKLLDEVMARLPGVEFIVREKLDPNADMQAIYAKCAVGLRLTEHDGLSNTVCEMGLMGRKCVWNGDTPNAIPYKSVEDIVLAIHVNLDNDRHDEVADAMRCYLQLPDSWKTTEFYGPKPMQTMPDTDKPYDYEDYFDFRYKQGERGAGGPDPDGDEAKWTCDKIRELLFANQARSVVEVGCGSMVRWDSLPVNDYLGIDVSNIALRHAQIRFPGASFVQRDVTVESIPEADAIICIDMLQHIKPDDLPGVLERLKASARKVLIVKTSVNIPDGYYQFNHEWSSTGAKEIAVPGVPVSRLFVFERAMVPA